MLFANKILLNVDLNYWLNRNEFRKANRKEYEKKNHNDLRTSKIQSSHRFKQVKVETMRNRIRNVVEVHVTLLAIKALLKIEKQEENFINSRYWRRRETIYTIAYDVLSRESALECVKRHVYIERKRFDTFLASKALLRNENYEEFAWDFKYWLKREKYYYIEHKKFERKFWDRLRFIRFNKKKVTLKEIMNDAHWDAYLLSNYLENRIILKIEDFSENEENFEYWLHWKTFYR